MILGYGQDLMVGAIQGWPQQVVHRTVHYQKCLAADLLAHQDRGQQGAGLAHNGPAGLDAQLESAAREGRAQLPAIAFDRCAGLALFVADRQAASQIDRADRHPALSQPSRQAQHLAQHLVEDRRVEDLRADVAAYAREPQGRPLRRLVVERLGGLQPDPELVFAEPRRNVRVGLGVDVRVDAQGNGGPCPDANRDLAQQVQLLFRLAVERTDALLKCVLEFGCRLADTRIDHGRGVPAGAQHTVELAAGDDVESRAFGHKQRQHCERRVRLDRVMDLVRHIGQGAFVGAVIVSDGAGRIDIGWRARRPGDSAQGRALAVELAVLVLKLL